MKHIVILGDGMADLPMERLRGRTPLMAAEKPYINELARRGCCGLLKTVPDDMPAGSAIANMGVLGYDVHKVYEGRGVLEAASMGVDITPGDLALRCNLICIEDGKIKNHSAGHITTAESHELIKFLNDNLATDMVKFYPGVSYRHLMIIGGGNKYIDCVPPHDVPGREFMPLLVKPSRVSVSDVPESCSIPAVSEDSSSYGTCTAVKSQALVNSEAPTLHRMSASETAGLLNDLILKSQELLACHPINIKRIVVGKDPANSIWPWSPGYKPRMPSLQQLLGIKKSAVISAVDLIRGVGVYAGMDVLHVEGATGLYDTNYEGKARAAIDALRNGAEFVYLHVEASDEAGHEGNADLKVKTVEFLDNRLVRLIMEASGSLDEPLALAVLPDHPTPCDVRTHTHAPVPFLIYKPGSEADSVEVFDEESAKKGSYGLLEGDEFIKAFLS